MNTYVEAVASAALADIDRSRTALPGYSAR